MKVEYESNNSGGSWWLKDEDWIAMEKAGWDVGWGDRWFCHSKSFLRRGRVNAEFMRPPCCRKEKFVPGSGYPTVQGECNGHRSYVSYDDIVRNGEPRFFGCLAMRASKDFASIADAIKEFEEITGQDTSDEGCNCCGPPHTFISGGRHISGAEALELLYKDVPSSIREACDRLNND